MTDDQKQPEQSPRALQVDPIDFVDVANQALIVQKLVATNNQLGMFLGKTQEELKAAQKELRALKGEPEPMAPGLTLTRAESQAS